jgi:hypothetical protein
MERRACSSANGPLVHALEVGVSPRLPEARSNRFRSCRWDRADREPGAQRLHPLPDALIDFDRLLLEAGHRPRGESEAISSDVHDAKCAALVDDGRRIAHGGRVLKVSGTDPLAARVL